MPNQNLEIVCETTVPTTIQAFLYRIQAMSPHTWPLIAFKTRSQAVGFPLHNALKKQRWFNYAPASNQLALPFRITRPVPIQMLEFLPVYDVWKLQVQVSETETYTAWSHAYCNRAGPNHEILELVAYHSCPSNFRNWYDVPAPPNYCQEADCEAAPPNYCQGAACEAADLIFRGFGH